MCPWLVPAREQDPAEADDGEPVRAMTLVLRMERDPRPSRTALLEAAATAAVALCLDKRAASDGPWYDAVAVWAGAGRIRKLARRARTAHWRAVQDDVLAPGLTCERDAAEVRALVPGPVDDVVHEVRRLQIGGTDLPVDEPAPAPPPTVWLSPEVEQSTGKAAAQVGHASMILATVLDAAGRDPHRACSVAVRAADRAAWDGWVAALDEDPSGRAAWERHGVVPVRDAGFTEVAPGTVTCMAQDAPDAP